MIVKKIKGVLVMNAIRYCLLCLVALTTWITSVSAASVTDVEPLSITIPGPLNKAKQRNPFVEKLLVKIFAAQGYQLSIDYCDCAASKARSIRELSIGNQIDLDWSVSSHKREKFLRAIKQPIYQGKIGWRVLLVRASDVEKFSEVRTVTELRRFKAVQRYDWEDYDVFIENKLPVEGSLTFKKMSLAVANNGADYFPRSILEIAREAKLEQNKDLVVEPSLIIKYPSANYFFVRKGNEKLAKIIEQGFSAILDSGEYQQLFDEYFHDAIKGLNLNQRHVIRLVNPNFSALPIQQ